ncbi:hypothetical protein [Staphylococcus phage SAP6]|nr:hypothetical protein [Staphylococcus phage StAP1]WAW12146.1 hypothetical protein [Staphylococcus phage SAP6]
MTNILNYDTIQEDDISKETFNLLIEEPLTLSYVSIHSDFLDNKYDYIYKSLGFDNFMDCYLYVTREPERIYKGGAKDIGSLNKVKRTVVRNGKEIEMTIYEDNKNDDKPKESNSEEPKEPKTAKGSRVITHGDDEKPNPKKIASSLSTLKNKGVNTDHIDGNASLYKEFVDDNNNTIGLASFKETDSDIILHGYVSDFETTGVGARSIIELIYLAIKKNKNAVVYAIELPQAIEFLKLLGFIKNKDYYVLKKQDIKLFLGEYSELT